MGKSFSIGQRPPVQVFLAAALTAGKSNPSVNGTTKQIFTSALWPLVKVKLAAAKTQVFLASAVSAPLKTKFFSSWPPVKVKMVAAKNSKVASFFLAVPGGRR